MLGGRGLYYTLYLLLRGYLYPIPKTTDASTIPKIPILVTFIFF